MRALESVGVIVQALGATVGHLVRMDLGLLVFWLGTIVLIVGISLDMRE